MNKIPLNLYEIHDTKFDAAHWINIDTIIHLSMDPIIFLKNIAFLTFSEISLDYYFTLHSKKLRTILRVFFERSFLSSIHFFFRQFCFHVFYVFFSDHGFDLVYAIFSYVFVRKTLKIFRAARGFAFLLCSFQKWRPYYQQY